MTLLPMTEGGFPTLFAWRSGAREEFQVKDDREAIAASGGRLKGDP
jgi:hypothetical protein